MLSISTHTSSLFGVRKCLLRLAQEGSESMAISPQSDLPAPNWKGLSQQPTRAFPAASMLSTCLITSGTNLTFLFVGTCGLMIFLPHSCEKVGAIMGVEVSWNNRSCHLEVRSTLLSWGPSPGCRQCELPHLPAPAVHAVGGGGLGRARIYTARVWN